ncbi:hypothetical protein L3X38_029284 [Prunus dulcis]|uniref:Uncharacterized protein n=1 Tax=Prunus dulcis TaxID=3755 RepID=A0AAD4Z177_PRUDU|nr:hypothetical protein L3X38_029284 [Prunus dulcis]
MEGRYESQAFASAELTSGEDVGDLQGKLSEIEKALAEAVGRRAQLDRLWTSVLEELRPLRDRVASAKIASAIVASARGAYRSGALNEVKFNKKGEYVGGGVSNEPPLLEPVANFTGGYIIRGARIFNRAKLYLLPEEIINEIFELENPKSLDGFMFDTSAGSLLPLKLLMRKSGSARVSPNLVIFCPRKGIYLRKIKFLQKDTFGKTLGYRCGTGRRLSDA